MAFYFKQIAVLILCSAIDVEAISSIIDGTIYRNVYDKVVMPTLGRGYSPADGSVFTYCLDESRVIDTTFDFHFENGPVPTGGVNAAKAYIQSSFSRYASVNYIAEKVGYQLSNGSSRYYVAVMGVEKYYETIDDSGTDLKVEAAEFLRRNDFFSFFSVCGPYYIRSMRRGSELATIFNYETPSEKSEFYIKALMIEINRFLGGADMDDYTEQTSAFDISYNLMIDVYGLGLDISEEETDQFFIEDFEDWGRVTEGAFQAAVQDPARGFIRSIEVIPYSHMLSFGDHTGATGHILGVNEDGTEHRVPTSMKWLNFISNGDLITTVTSLISKKMKKTNLLVQCIRDLASQTETTLQGTWVVRKQDYISPTDAKFTALPPVIVAGSFTLEANEREIIQAKRLLHILEGYDSNVNLKYRFEREQEEIRDFMELYVGPCTNTFYGTDVFIKNWMEQSACQNTICTLPGAKIVSGGACELASPEDWEYLVENFCMPNYKADLWEILPVVISTASFLTDAADFFPTN